MNAVAVESAMQRRWDKQLAAYVQANFRANHLSQIAGLIAAGIQKLTTVALIWKGASLVMDGGLTIGQLIAFNMLAHGIGNNGHYKPSCLRVSPSRLKSSSVYVEI